jgi:hypothetical protein
MGYDAILVLSFMMPFWLFCYCLNLLVPSVSNGPIECAVTSIQFWTQNNNWYQQVYKDIPKQQIGHFQVHKLVPILDPNQQLVLTSLQRHTKTTNWAFSSS